MVTEGSASLLLPTKVNPLWHSELLPVFFLLSAIMAGPAVMIVEHTLATHFLRLQPRMDVLRSLARGLTVLVVVYLLLRLGDVLYRGVGDAALSFGFEARWFWLEITVGLLVPLALLFIPEIERHKWGLCAAAASRAGPGLHPDLVLDPALTAGGMDVTMTVAEPFARLREWRWNLWPCRRRARAERPRPWPGSWPGWCSP